MKTIFIVLLALTCGAVYAQTTPVPAYEGGGFAWDYPAGVSNHAGFKLTIDGVAGSTSFSKDVREVKFVDTVLQGQPLAKTYTVKFIATAVAPAQDSAPSTLVINYQARPQLQPPTNTRTILEWIP